MKRYEELEVFLAAYISERPSVEEAIEDYIKNEYDTVEMGKRDGREVEYDVIPQCLKEGREVVKLEPFPYKGVCSLANGTGLAPGDNYEGGIATERSAKNWLSWLMDTLEEEAKKAGKL